jgi:hypothetical protein
MSAAATFMGEGVEREPGRTGDWTQVYSGKRFYVSDPRPEDVDIIDIAVHLGNLCRYGGGVGHFYSVAEHSVHVSYMVPEQDALHGLLHDAPEFVLADQTRPVKRELRPDNRYFVLERLIWNKAIAPAFGLGFTMPASVKYADDQICLREKAVLKPRAGAWNLPYEDPTDVIIECLIPEFATNRFLRRFAELTDMTLQQHDALWTRLEDYREQDRIAFGRRAP